MKLATSGPRTSRPWRSGPLLLSLVALLSVGLLVASVGTAQATATAVPLGTASTFAVLAGSGVTNTGTTTLNGDLGTFPTTSITGSSSLVVTGTDHAGDAVTQGAKTDLVTAFDAAAGEGPTSPIVADLGGQTLVPGVYNTAISIGITGVLTLDGGGNPSAVFVFQAGSTLTTASASQVVLTDGAQACNVFWQVGSSATLGTASSFTGTVLAAQSITATTSATVDGRLLASNGAVTLDTNIITVPTCVASTSTSSTPATTAPPTTAVPPVGRAGATPVAATTTTVRSAKPASAATAPSTAPPSGSSVTSASAAAAAAAAAGSTTSRTSVTVPPAHTGEPWAGWPYWLVIAVLAMSGLLAVDRARRHRTAEH